MIPFLQTKVPLLWILLIGLSEVSVPSSIDESVSSVLTHGAEAGSSRAPHFDGADCNLVISRVKMRCCNIGRS
jgi:hypothetical protein